jgi:hypothetical protein
VIFRQVDGVYTFADAEHGVEFRIERLRRDSRGELTGELSVSTGLLSARTTDDGVLCAGSFNFSYPRARDEWAKSLSELARTGGKVDFRRKLEEICGRVAKEERERGEPAVILRDVGAREATPMFKLLGLHIPREHPSSLFGAGDSLKSFLATAIINEQSRAGVRVGVLDWEMDKYTWSERQAQVDPEMPDVIYVKCERPLAFDLDRLRRIIRHERIEWAWLDSAAYLTAGRPEEAEAAMGTFRAFRQLGLQGGNIIAHSRREDGDDQPFGSVFWNNSFRATWNVKRASTSEDGCAVQLGVFPRKFNLGPRPPAVGLRVVYDGPRVYFERTDVAAIDELAESVPLWQRIRAVVKTGPQTLVAIAGELNYENVESLDRIVRRHKGVFQKVSGSDGITRIALVERRTA